MKRTLVAVAVTAALCSVGAFAQAPAAPAKPAPMAAATKPAPATNEKVLDNQAQYDLVLKEQLAQGQKDTPELRNAIKDRLNMVQLLAGEAKKEGIDKSADVRNQIDISSQQILASAYITDWLKKNPVPDAELHKEYDQIKAKIGDKEYKVRHILVKTEDQAKEIIAELQKGAKFDELAKARSEDPGSKDKGGDLDWNSPANFVKPFGDAMKATPKGKFTPQPVQTQFGWHVIEVEDIRDAKVPTFEEVKPQLQERMKQEWVQRHIAELRSKNGV